MCSRGMFVRETGICASRFRSSSMLCARCSNARANFDADLARARMVHFGRHRSGYPGDEAQGSRMTHRRRSFVATGTLRKRPLRKTRAFVDRLSCAKAKDAPRGPEYVRARSRNNGNVSGWCRLRQSRKRHGSDRREGARSTADARRFFGELWQDDIFGFWSSTATAMSSPRSISSRGTSRSPCGARASNSTIRDAEKSTSSGSSSGRRLPGSERRSGAYRHRRTSSPSAAAIPLDEPPAGLPVCGVSQARAVSGTGASASRRGATSVMKRRIAVARCSFVPQSLPVTRSSVPKPPVFS